MILQKNRAAVNLILLMSGIILLFYCRTVDNVFHPPSRDAATRLAGYIMDDSGPVANAVVSIQATSIEDVTDANGRFDFHAPMVADSVALTAWLPGYFIGGGTRYVPGDTSIVIMLHKHHDTDNPSYAWIGAHAVAGDPSNCENCHAASANDPATLPFDDWAGDAHALSAHNHRFLTMYLGTDVYGNQSPDTRYGYNRDYGTFPIKPLYDETYFGPGYTLDFPGTAGNCAACHVPAAAIDNAYGIDPSQVSGTAAEGIGCDFCHKVWDVKLNPATGMPYENMPGVLSFRFRRPPEGHQFFAGPLDDVAPGEDTYTPIQKESAYCSPCHRASFWGVTIYNSFGEWLESPYSDPATGKTCQDCHMPRGHADHFARIDKGGLIRASNTLSSHRMPGALDENLLQNAVSLSADGRVEGNEVIVNVSVENDRTGHHVPTDSPLRHLILLITAVDAAGDTLQQVSGGILPDWCGLGDARLGYYAGLPGKAYAKILEERWTGISPSGAYWNMTRVVSDNRLPALGKDQSEYRFICPVTGTVYIDVSLYFRRAFRAIADWKSWTDPDILMASQSIVLEQ